MISASHLVKTSKVLKVSPLTVASATLVLTTVEDCSRFRVFNCSNTVKLEHTHFLEFLGFWKFWSFQRKST